MARPPTLPRFATVPTGGYPGRVEPNSGRKDTGYDDDEAPPAGEHNWLFGVVGDWLDWLDEEQQRLQNAALLDQANTFTAGPLEVDVNDSEIAALVTRTNAGDDANPANKWKAVLGFEVGDNGGYVNQYAGTRLGPGQFIAVINAVWDPATQLWTADNTAFDSLALIMDAATGMYVSRRPAGAGTWSSWPSASGDLVVGGLLTAASMHATSDISVGTAGEFLNTPVKLRTTPIRIGDAVGDVTRNSDGSVSQSGTGKIAWPIKLPNGAPFGDIQVLHSQASAVGAAFGLVRRTGVDWTTPALPSYSTPVTATGPASTGLKVTTLATAGLSYDNAIDELELVWDLAGGSTANKVIAIRMVDWIDPGPRND